MKIGKGRLASLFVFACGTIHAGNVVTDWNTIASTTIVTNGGKSPAPSSSWQRAFPRFRDIARRQCPLPKRATRRTIIWVHLSAIPRTALRQASPVDASSNFRACLARVSARDAPTSQPIEEKSVVIPERMAMGPVPRGARGETSRSHNLGSRLIALDILIRLTDWKRSTSISFDRRNFKNDFSWNRQVWAMPRSTR